MVAPAPHAGGGEVVETTESGPGDAEQEGQVEAQKVQAVVEGAASGDDPEWPRPETAAGLAAKAPRSRRSRGGKSRPLSAAAGSKAQ